MFEEGKVRLFRRYFYDYLLQIISLSAVILCITILFCLITNIVKQAIPVFSHYYLSVQSKDNNINLHQLIAQNFKVTEDNDIKMIKNSIISRQEHSPLCKKKYLLLTSQANAFLRDTQSHNLLHLSDNVKRQLLLLHDEKKIISKFHVEFFKNSDSQEAEIAGVFGSFIGSCWTILLTVLFAIPIATMAAFYLEEYAPDNWFTSIIEININNLAAIPSIIFGLIGLSFYINFLDLTRSSSIVAALTLALMILPTMIISTRQSLKAIPDSLRQGITALGVSKMQMIKDHLFPLVIPGITTGTILSILRAIGETAPLLMIGMVSFIATPPNNVSMPATVLPIQIYLWTKNIEAEFTSKTAAAILILIIMLICLNFIAIIVQKKYSYKLS